MKLDKLFGSKAKADILKYLVFRRQGISMRAFESELEWSFPAIKKQIDQLDNAGVIEINKESNKRSIYLTEGLGQYIRNMMLYMLQCDIQAYQAEHEMIISRTFFGKMFGKDLDIDLVVLFTEHGDELREKIKQDMENLFREYLIEHTIITLMSKTEFDRRYRVADKFVLSLMRSEAKGS